MSEIKKIFYSMGEVSEMLDVNPSLLRFWEKKFDILRPHKNKKGNRMFTPEDVRNLKIIYHLVKENGMTLSGAQKRMKQNLVDVQRDMELSERLHAVKALLLEIKQQICDTEYNETGKNEQIIVDNPGEETPDATRTGHAKVSETEIIQERAIETDDSTVYDDDSEPQPEEDLEQVVEMAFAAENDIYEADFIPSDDEEQDSEEESADNTEDYCEEQTDDTSLSQTDSLPDDTQDEPQTETILEEGMLFAVQQEIRPKTVEVQTEQQIVEPIAPPKDDKPQILEQTLF